MFCVVTLALWAAAAAPAQRPGAAPPGSAAAPDSSVVPFRIEALPRVDPVFGDASTLRAAVERFLALQGEMDRVRDEFSGAVHETLAALRPGPGHVAPRACPSATSAPYARALSAGARYLTLGQELQARYREIVRGDQLGDTVGLTPDYRWKVKRAKELYRQLLTDYREMRVAFYDQLGAELRHARCRLPTTPAPPVVADVAPPTETSRGAPNPSDPGAWVLDDPAPEPDPTAEKTATPAGKSTEPAKTQPVAGEPAPTAQSIWIDIDNTLCALPTRVSIDGQSLGEVPPRKRTSLRTRAGPHDVCVLPAADPRACGAPGTLRRAYLHESWALTVHCPR
jgi:hypothetical protein